MELHVDRLALRVPGLTASDSRRLAELIASRLASADAPGAITDLARLRVRIAARPGEPLDALADRIAGELLATIARTP